MFMGLLLALYHYDTAVGQIYLANEAVTALPTELVVGIVCAFMVILLITGSVIGCYLCIVCFNCCCEKRHKKMK